MRSNLLGVVLLVLVSLVSVGVVQGQTTKPPWVTPGEVEDLIKTEIDRRKDAWIEELKDYLRDEIDFGEEFKALTGITIGAVIAILIVIIIVPNLIILAIIFLFCYCCRCGAFRRQKGYYRQPPPPHHQQHVTKKTGPMVPPKPQQHQSPASPIYASQQAPASGGMWPWGGQQGGANQNQKW